MPLTWGFEITDIIWIQEPGLSSSAGVPDPGTDAWWLWRGLGDEPGLIHRTTMRFPIMGLW